MSRRPCVARPTVPARTVASGALSAALTAAALAVLQRHSPGGAARWRRTNHRGAVVTLLEGPALVAGAATASLAAGHLPGAVAVCGAGAFGALDDLHGDTHSKGLRGHLAALRRGRLTTGAVKVVGLAASGLLTAALLDHRGARAFRLGRHGAPGRAHAAGRSRATTGLATLVGGGVVAGAANVANLFDLRPGRALKVVLATSVPLAAGRDGRTAAVAAGSALALLPHDLAGRTMLGDTGANAAGALVGTAVLERCGLRGRLVALGLLTALTLVSEQVSFTRVIESTPGLRELDALGRRPAG